MEGVKLDECDDQPESPTSWSFPAATAFPSGLDGELMHSLFGLLYQQTMLEPYREKGLRTWGLVRNSHALASPVAIRPLQRFLRCSLLCPRRCQCRIQRPALDAGSARAQVRSRIFIGGLEAIVFSHDAVD